MPRSTPPIVLTIAGSDPSGGAGIQADLKTFSALGVYGASVITALTAQNTTGVTGVHKVPADFIRMQFDAVASDLAINAVKTGMLGDVETVLMVAALLRKLKPAHLVADPVMVATSGDRLLDDNAIVAVREALIPLASIITPNLPEAAALLELPEAQSEAEMRDHARRLLGFGCGAVLLKGGHGQTAEAIDVLATAEGELTFSRPRLVTRNTHGTGCTMSAAIAAGLAQGCDLEESVQSAKEFVWNALFSSSGWKIGAGNGPVDHLFYVRQSRHHS